MQTLTKFPDVYASIRLDDLLAAYEAAPLRIRTAVQGLSAANVLAHPIPNKWSVQQIVCHLADAEVLGAFRFRLAIAQPGATLPCYDQDVWAGQFDYTGRGVAGLDRALTLFAALRADVVALVSKLDPETWKRRVIHPEWGELTLRQILELYADHGERHVSQILDRRQLLGQTLDLPLMLPHRLY